MIPTPRPCWQVIRNDIKTVAKTYSPSCGCPVPYRMAGWWRVEIPILTAGRSWTCSPGSYRRHIRTGSIELGAIRAIEPTCVASADRTCGS